MKSAAPEGRDILPLFVVGRPSRKRPDPTIRGVVEPKRRARPTRVRGKHSSVLPESGRLRKHQFRRPDDG